LKAKTIVFLTLFHVGAGEETPPSISFFEQLFFYKNSYTYTHPIQLKNLKKKYYSIVDNHPKLTEITKNG
jgi:hypothetical protein